MVGLVGGCFFGSHTCFTGFGRELVVATIEVFIREVGVSEAVVFGDGCSFLGSHIYR